MVSPGEISLLCRLCLVKDQVNVPIFGEQGDIRQIFLKISSCLPVTVSKEDQLPKNICEGCSDKLDLLFAFWNSSRDAEKTLVSWLKQASVDNANETINAIAKQISAKPVAEVKQETDDGQNIKIQQSSEEGKNDESEEAPPPPKRARRTAAVKAQISISQEDESEEEEDDVDAVEPLTKVEDESDMSDNDGADNQPLSSFVDMPGTSADDQEQAGPSGVGKDGGADAPKPRLKYVMRDTVSGRTDKSSVYKDETLSIKKEADGYHCPYCFRTFQQRCKLTSHIVVHSNSRPFTCKTCKKNFKHKRVLDYHEKTVHGQCEQYSCDICGKVFSNKRNCVVHRNRHSKKSTVKCTVCDKGFISNFYLKKHMIVHTEERPLQCSICGRTFKHQRVLDYHFKTLHSKPFEELWECNLCSKRFNTKRNYEVHRKRHTRVPEAFCEHCGKGFLSKASLSKHLDAMHLGLRHICDVCGASIGDKGNLKNHMKLHDPNYKKPPPETCTLCNKQFSDLKRHYKAAHENNGKNFSCEYCGKFFRGKDGLKFHLMVHRGEKPFSCQFCGKGFILNTFLQQHLRTHPESNVEPFRCSVCDRIFVKKSLLEHHINTHTGARPFQCQYCEKNFTGRKYLNSHVRSMHPEKRTTT